MQVLEKNNRVELRPTVQQLFDLAHKVGRDIINATQAVPRLALQLTDKQRKDMVVSSQSPRPQKEWC